jgi:hypothetical protein
MILDSIIDFIPKDPTHASESRAYTSTHPKTLPDALNLFLFFAQKQTQRMTKKHSGRLTRARSFEKSHEREREFKRDDKPSKTYERSHVSL